LLATLRARIGHFAVWFTIALLLLLAVWRFLSPFYAQGMATVGQTLLNATGMLPPDSHLEARDRRVWIVRPVTKSDGSAGMATVNVLDDATYVNIILLVSLTIATPLLGLAAKAKVCLAGVAGLSILHLTDLYIKLRWTALYPGLQAHGMMPEAAHPFTVKLYEWFYAFFSVNGFGLFPILLWFAAAAFWWPRQAQIQDEDKPAGGDRKRKKGAAARKR